MIRVFCICLLLCSLGGCATQLTRGAEGIHVVTADQKASCTRVSLVSVQQKLGPDKAGNALKKAMNEAAAAGANSIYIVSSDTDWAEGASVVAEALKCSQM